MLARVGRVIGLSLVTSLLVGACSTGATPSTGVTVAPSTAPSVAPPSDPAVEAPVAELAIGDQRHPGVIGGYTLDTYTQSAPWIPAEGLDAVPFDAAADVTIEVKAPVGVADWDAVTAPADDPTGTNLTVVASGTGTPAFRLDAGGDRVLQVLVRFADGRGDAAFYWHLAGT